MDNWGEVFVRSGSLIQSSELWFFEVVIP